mmetsp:Transcript_108202/g.304877  ORF Transcript_108202/g.304877 Transcript_108202/m.304877 type:complete len:235 (+) Transcript_108202:91-795(+)
MAASGSPHDAGQHSSHNFRFQPSAVAPARSFADRSFQSLLSEAGHSFLSQSHVLFEKPSSRAPRRSAPESSPHSLTSVEGTISQDVSFSTSERTPASQPLCCVGRALKRRGPYLFAPAARALTIAPDGGTMPGYSACKLTGLPTASVVGCHARPWCQFRRDVAHANVSNATTGPRSWRLNGVALAETCGGWRSCSTGRRGPSSLSSSLPPPPTITLQGARPRRSSSAQRRAQDA